MGSADEVEIINHLGELGKLYLMLFWSHIMFAWVMGWVSYFLAE